MTSEKKKEEIKQQQKPLAQNKYNGEEEEAVTLAINESLQSFSIKEDEIKKKKKPVDPVSENYEDDTELQRALDESYQHISPPLSIPTYPSQNIEESLDKDIATALLMSMEELEFTEPQTYENLPLPVQAPQVPPELEPESEPVPQLMDDSVIDISEAIEESKMEEEKKTIK